MVSTHYVTVTRLATPADPQALSAYLDELDVGMRDYGDDEPQGNIVTQGLLHKLALRLAARG